MGSGQAESLAVLFFDPVLVVVAGVLCFGQVLVVVVVVVVFVSGVGVVDNAMCFVGWWEDCVRSLLFVDCFGFGVVGRSVRAFLGIVCSMHDGLHGS